MLSVDGLLELIDEKVLPLPARRPPLEECRGLRLREDVVAREDEPAFDRSAMDGFAVQEGAGPGWLTISHEILPGEPPSGGIRPGHAARVYTGSALPKEVVVVKQEDILERDGKILLEPSTPRGFVRRRGSATRRGDILVPGLTMLSPAEIAVLAAVGEGTPLVVPRPRLAHLTTGREIVGISEALAHGQIRNTNGPLIRALVEQMGVAYVGNQHVDESLEAALMACEGPGFCDTDVLLISGGSSGGRYDRTAEILTRLGFAIFSRSVNCRPGKPFLFGTRGCQVAVGMPGNPVSHFVTFHLFVSRILRRLGQWDIPSTIHARLCEGVALVPDERETYWPALAGGGEVRAQAWLDSGHLSALLGVNALIRIRPHESPRAGSLVEIVSAS